MAGGTGVILHAPKRKLDSIGHICRHRARGVGVRTDLPAIHLMAGIEQGALFLSYAQEIALGVVMRVVAGNTFKLTARSELDVLIHQLGRTKLMISIGELPVISKTDRMIVREVIREVARPAGHERLVHRDWIRSEAHTSELQS